MLKEKASAPYKFNNLTRCSQLLNIPRLQGRTNCHILLPATKRARSLSVEVKFCTSSINMALLSLQMSVLCYSLIVLKRVIYSRVKDIICKKKCGIVFLQMSGHSVAILTAVKRTATISLIIFCGKKGR